MSMTDKMTNAVELSLTDIREIESRVKVVKQLMTKSAALWLEIASEFLKARREFKRLAYERFVNDAGFTKSVADKLVLIASCKHLYRSDAQQFVGFIDGWSTLYEITKLNNSQIDTLWDTLRRDPRQRLSRSLVHNLGSGVGPNDKVVVFVTIGAQESKLATLTPTQVKDFKGKLDELRSMFDQVPTAIVFKEHEKAVKLLLVDDTPKPNNDPIVTRTAA